MGFINWLLTSSIGKSLLTFLINKIWKYADTNIRKEIAKRELEKEISSLIKEYDEVVLWAESLKKDGLTEEEKNEIRKRKIAIESGIINTAVSGSRVR